MWWERDQNGDLGIYSHPQPVLRTSSATGQEQGVEKGRGTLLKLPRTETRLSRFTAPSLVPSSKEQVSREYLQISE
jgi:hypothetical protein